MINTHLEATSTEVARAQAIELLNGPANTSPVIAAGDFNAGPGTQTYGILVPGTPGGLTDTWSVTNPENAGNTWPLHLEDPFVPGATTPSERIDLVLDRGSLRSPKRWSATHPLT